jgi:DNA-binding transcriptional MerR regulator
MAVQELPSKEFYKLTEVCQATDTQPYVLRFWESEFPQLAPDRSPAGQPLYRQRHIEVVRRIKELLYDEEYSLDSARERLAEELAPGQGSARASAPAPGLPSRRDSAARGPAVEMVERRRYDDALDEIEHLRLALKDAERASRRAESAVHEAEARAEDRGQRLERIAAQLERLIEILG